MLGVGLTFQRSRVLSHAIHGPVARLCDSSPSLGVLRRATQSFLQENEAQPTNQPHLLKNHPELHGQISVHPLMPKPGEPNPLGEFSPYLPPPTIPGIRRAPRPLEEDPIAGSERLLKIRRPSPDGPYAEYRQSIGRWHSFVDEHISSSLTSLYIMLIMVFIFAPNDLTFKEVVCYLDP